MLKIANIRRRRRLMLVFMFLQMQTFYRDLWVHPLNDLRNEKGEFYTLYADLRHFSPRFFRMYRMSVGKFDMLLAMLTPRLRKKSVNTRLTISPEHQLVLTLRYTLRFILYK